MTQQKYPATFYHGSVFSQTAPTPCAKSSQLLGKMGSVPALNATNSSATFNPIYLHGRRCGARRDNFCGKIKALQQQERKEARATPEGNNGKSRGLQQHEQEVTTVSAGLYYRKNELHLQQESASATKSESIRFGFGLNSQTLPYLDKQQVAQ